MAIPTESHILCAADWEGHPLRKDYQLQDYYHGTKVPYDDHNEHSGFRGEPIKLISSENPFTDKREKPDV